MFYKNESQNYVAIEVFYSHNADSKGVEFYLSKQVWKTLFFPKQTCTKNSSISNKKSKYLLQLCSDDITPSIFHQ